MNEVISAKISTKELFLLIEEVKSLILKEFLFDLRSKNLLVSAVIYVFSTIFICYLALQQTDQFTWNALVWITMLFGITNAAYKIFQNESGSQKLYTYTLARPESVILSKLIYQMITSLILASMVLAGWILLFNESLAKPMLFGITLVLGVSAMSNILTLNNAMAMESKSGTAIMAILSFPIIIPVLLISIKGSYLGITGLGIENAWSYLGGLLALNALTLALSYILFPYIWRY